MNPQPLCRSAFPSFHVFSTRGILPALSTQSYSGDWPLRRQNKPNRKPSWVSGIPVSLSEPVSGTGKPEGTWVLSGFCPVMTQLMLAWQAVGEPQVNIGLHGFNPAPCGIGSKIRGGEQRLDLKRGSSCISEPEMKSPPAWRWEHRVSWSSDFQSAAERWRRKINFLLVLLFSQGEKFAASKGLRAWHHFERALQDHRLRYLLH